MVGGVLSLASLSLGVLLPFGAVAGFFLVVLAGDITLLLVPVGMLGFHALQRHGYERTGSAGFWLVVAWSLMTALGVAGFLVWGDFLQDTAPVSLKLGPLVLLVGFAVYGMATLQARMLPRWCGVAFVALPVALAADVFMPWGPFASIVVIFGLVWLALG